MYAVAGDLDDDGRVCIELVARGELGTGGSIETVGEPGSIPRVMLDPHLEPLLDERWDRRRNERHAALTG
jgi:hypothetical protein